VALDRPALITAVRVPGRAAAQEAVLHVTAAELRDIGCKPGHIKKFMKRLMDLQTIVLTKNEAAVRDWVYSLRPRRGADGSVPPPVRKLTGGSSSSSSASHPRGYVSLRTLRRQGRSTDELDAIHERHPSFDIVGLPPALHHRHMSHEVVGAGIPLRGSIDEGQPTRHASLSSLGSRHLSSSSLDDFDEVAVSEEDSGEDLTWRRSSPLAIEASGGGSPGTTAAGRMTEPAAVGSPAAAGAEVQIHSPPARLSAA